MSELCERCGCEIATRACVYRGDKRVEHSPIQECIDALRQRLAAAEAQADHVSFEHEVDTQQLEARLAAAEARIEWFEKSGGVAVHTIVFQRQMEIESLQQRLAAAEAESRRLLSLIDDTAKAWLAGCEGIPWVGAIDAAMVAAVAEIRQLRTKLAAAEARSLDPTVAQQKLLDELAAARAEIVRLKTISVAQLVREAELSKNPGELEPRHLED